MRRGPKPPKTATALPDGGKPPKCPSWFRHSSRLEWRRLAPKLHAAGLLTPGDVALFTAYCNAWGEWLDAETAVSKLEPDEAYTLTTSGTSAPSPVVRMRNDAFVRLMKASREMGLSPHARGQVKAGAAAIKDDDAGSEFIG